MTYDRIEDVPDRDVARSLDYIGAVTRLARSRTAVRIATDIANECLLRGMSGISHKAFERRTGVCRRTLQRTIHSLLDLQLIERVGSNEDGQAIYSACWERGDEYRAWGRKFDAEWEGARRRRGLKAFQAPPYPLPVTGAAHGQG